MTKKIIDKTITFALVYGATINGSTKKNNTAAIILRAYKDRKNKYINTGIYVRADQWNKEAGGRVVKHHLKSEYNQRLQDIILQYEIFVIAQIKNNGKCTLADLDQLKGDYKEISFSEFMENEMKTRNIQPQSKKPHRTTFNKLLDFHKTEVQFDDLTYKFLKAFELYLIGENQSANTRERHFKTLRSYVNEAIRCDYMEFGKNPFIKFKFKGEKTYKEPLTEDEVRALEQWTPPTDKAHLGRVRDFFLFACYTSLRFSDVAKINGNNFFDTPKGLILSLEVTKTGKPYKVNTKYLFCKAGSEQSELEKLCRKYLEQAGDIKTVPFLKFTNQYLNRALKEVFAMVDGINQNRNCTISSHLARHTFSNIMAKYIPAPTLQSIMQHSKLSITQGYINQSLDDIEKVLSEIKIG